MTKKIHILPEPIARCIAAGEVVERPASVVKELMENAVDAGATEIVVELETAGLQKIRVYDNGEGIAPEDVPLALQRHGTSKVRDLSDLYNIQTLGFRGEALPSIAAVARLTLRTRPPHVLSGIQVTCEGAEIGHPSEVGCPVGTEVVVQNLFFNLPVKRKFMKSIRSELQASLNHFLRLGLSYPRISMRLSHDGRILHELLRTESDDVRMEAVLGRETVDQLRRIELKEGDVRVRGYGSLPSLSRGNADGFYLYVNRRFVRDRVIYRAVIEAYRHILPAGRFPVVLLWIDVPPQSVDVNVHPTKAEVRFRDSERVFQAVRRALGSLLEPGFVPPRREVEGETFPSSMPWQAPSGIPPSPSTNALWQVREPGGPEWTGRGEPSSRLLGQAQGTYLVCEAEDGLLVIDQHAAHERILYERYRREFESKSMTLIRFLVPPLIELDAEESFLLSRSLEELQSLGFELDPAGERLFALRSFPSVIDEKDASNIIKEILGELKVRRKEGRATETIEALLIALSCHGAIRANDALRKEEMTDLLERLAPFTRSSTCPHGRPLFYLLPWDELRKQFRRSR